MKWTLIFVEVTGLLAGCGGTTESVTTDSGVVDSAQSDALSDVSSDSPTDSPSDSRSDTAADGTSVVCGDKTCAAGQACTRTYTSGGACRACPDDGGACPSGQHCGGSCCVPDVVGYTYECKAVPPSCGAAPSCTTSCGSALCPGIACPCESVEGTLVTCHCRAP